MSCFVTRSGSTRCVKGMKAIRSAAFFSAAAATKLLALLRLLADYLNVCHRYLGGSSPLVTRDRVYISCFPDDESPIKEIISNVIRSSATGSLNSIWRCV
jgi:hypothetical protein